jgi:lipid-A-disaccharide synthase
MTLIYLIAGEASGDVLGARLIEALRKRRPDLVFAGIGGARMAALGFESLFPMRDLAVMGFIEVLPKLRMLSARLDQTVADVERRRPDLLVTIDSPGFTLRLLARVKALGIKRAHYVAPQVWAWHEERVKKFPGLWDLLLCLFPFEPEFFARHGLAAQFVGHPVLMSGADQGDGARFRARHGIAADAPVLILMPGSRKSEVPRLLPVFGAALKLLHQNIPDLVAVVPVSAVVAETVVRAARDWDTPPILVTELDDKHDAYAAAGAALTKSGTSTLELALAGVPMAVTYRTNPITAFFARRMIKVPFVAMVNLLAGRELVPELLLDQCNPKTLTASVMQLLRDPAVADAQRAGFAEVVASLRSGDTAPPDAAAKALLALLDRG